MKHYCNVVDIKSLLTTADTYHYFQSKQLDYSSRSLTSPYHKVAKKPTAAQFGKTTTDLAQYLSQNPPTFHQLMDKTLSGKMNLSCTIDKNGYLIDNGKKTKTFWNGNFVCPQKPLRLKVRNIAGDETIISLVE